MPKKKKTGMFFEKTPHGVSVKVCCASCEHKAHTSSVAFRKCRFRGDVAVRPSDSCGFWEMSEFWKKFCPGDK